LIQSILDAPTVRWLTNPRAIVDGAVNYNRFQVSVGLSRARVLPEELFDFRFYDRVIAKYPQRSKY
jgi:hypothetical protein